MAAKAVTDRNAILLATGGGHTYDLGMSRVPISLALLLSFLLALATASIGQECRTYGGEADDLPPPRPNVFDMVCNPTHYTP